MVFKQSGADDMIVNPVITMQAIEMGSSGKLNEQHI